MSKAKSRSKLGTPAKVTGTQIAEMIEISSE